MSNYAELLKHPLWQKKRLEVLNRAEFACENCGARDKTLHVHHTYYERGLNPWEYSDVSLVCLCEECHKKAEALLKELHRQLGNIASQLDGVGRLLGYVKGIDIDSFPFVEIDVRTYEEAQGVADAWGLSPEVVIDALTDGHIDGYTLNRVKQCGPYVSDGRIDEPLAKS